MCSNSFRTPRGTHYGLAEPTNALRVSHGSRAGIGGTAIGFDCHDLGRFLMFSWNLSCHGLQARNDRNDPMRASASRGDGVDGCRLGKFHKSLFFHRRSQRGSRCVCLTARLSGLRRLARFSGFRCLARPASSVVDRSVPSDGSVSCRSGLPWLGRNQAASVNPGNDTPTLTCILAFFLGSADARRS